MPTPKNALHKAPAGTFTRLTKAPAQSVVRHYYAPIWPVERPVFDSYLRMNMAWVLMLAEKGIVDRRYAVKVLAALETLERHGAGQFQYDPAVGDVYFNLEAWVIDHTSAEIGGIMYTGRSRGDGDTTAWRLYTRRGLLAVAEGLGGLANAMLAQADRHKRTVMPGYTGSQPAQPWIFGHYLLSFIDTFDRDFQRLQGVFGRVNQSLMGLGVGAGSDLALDRRRVADLLGFDGFVENSRQWSAVDALLETLSVCSILLSSLGQLATDLHTWSTQEFHMIELGDEFCTSSSFMPQKKNPYVLDKIRALAGEATGLLPAGLGVAKTLSEEFDLVSISMTSGVSRAIDHACAASELMTDVFPTMIVHEETMRRRALKFWTTASEIPTLIVRERGVAWRTAHRIGECLMRLAMERGLDPTELTGDLLDKAAEEVTGQALALPTETIVSALDPARFVETRVTAGSPNPAEIERMLVGRRKSWKANAAWTTNQLRQLSDADGRLRDGIRALAG